MFWDHCQNLLVYLLFKAFVYQVVVVHSSQTSAATVGWADHYVYTKVMAYVEQLHTVGATSTQPKPHIHLSSSGCLNPDPEF